MNTKAAAALTFAVALLVSPSTPAAFAAALPSIAPHHRALVRHQRPVAESGATTAIASARPTWTPFQGPFINPFATPPRPLEWPKIAAYPPGQGNTDGLSRNIDDCNKGCIDGPY